MAKPFVKWIGGKGRSLGHLLPLFPNEITNYHEPFVGGGALFLSMADRIKGQTFLADANGKLIVVWEEVWTHPEKVIAFLTMMEAEDSKEFFLAMRRKYNLGTHAFPMSGEFAAAFIYLNRATYNGLYRENLSGGFNAPFSAARKIGKGICLPDRIWGASVAMTQCNELYLIGMDFRETLKLVVAGDVVYLDPPYDGTYAQYTTPKFTEDDQRDLATIAEVLADANVTVIASNADTPLIRELYKDFDIYETQRVNSVNSNAEDRAPKKDLTICSF